MGRNGTLIGRGGGEREQVDGEVGGKGAEMERRDAGRGLCIWGRTEKD